MTTEEMSRSVDLHYNNIMSNQAPGLTEYEKSVALTRAQESIIIALYNGTVATSFEETEEFTTYLSPLVRQVSVTEEETDMPHIVADSHVFKLPEDMMFRTYESCVIASEDDKCIGEGKEVLIVPVTQDEFWRTHKDPFRGANGRKVLRLAYDIADSLSLDADTIVFGAEGGSDSVNVNTDGEWNVVDGGMTVDKPNKYVELVSKYPISEYLLRYVRYPDPIILEDLPDGLTIGGRTLRTPCALNPQIHERIVLEAVNILKSIWS